MNGSGKTKNAGRSLIVSGVVVYAVSNIITKVIGLFFKIPMSELLGNTGMAYFNAAYTVYVWFYMISTAGLPVAVSRLVAESRALGRFRQVRKLYRLALLSFLIIGSAGTAVMLIFSNSLAGLVDANAAKCIIALAPTLFFVCLSSAFRGYFQGFRIMVPTGISQILESLGKLVCGIILAKYAINTGKSLEMVAAYAVFGITIGVFAGLVYLWITKMFFRPEKIGDEFYEKFNGGNDECDGTGSLLGKLLKISVPITVSSSVMSLASLIDMSVMKTRLVAAGIPQETAVGMYGAYTTQCVSMFNLPPALIYPVAYMIVPLIAECMASGDTERRKRILESSFRITSIIAMPCALGMAAMSMYILPALFNSENSKGMFPLLSILSAAVFFIGVLATSNSALQGAGKEMLPIVSMAAGALVKVVSSWILVGIPAVNIYGTPVSTVLCYATAMVCNLVFLKRHVAFIPSVKKLFIRPFAASVLCGAAAFGSAYAVSYLLYGLEPYGRTANLLITACGIAVAVIVYIIAVFLFRAVGREDLLMLPKGGKIVRIAERLHLVR